MWSDTLQELPFWFYAFYIFIFGLCTGSFLNVVILRGLSGENIVLSRSKCPKCGSKLKWYMNIPLLSYLFLRGKCAFCHEKISFQYPVVEFLCALLFLFAFIAFGLSLKTIFVCIILSVFIALSVTDIKEMVIIDNHAYFLLFVCLLASLFNIFNIGFQDALSGAIFGFLFFELIALLGLSLIDCRIFGEGDGIMALGIGAIFGLKSFFIIAALSILIQLVFFVPNLFFKLFKTMKTKLKITYILLFSALLVFFCVLKLNLINTNIKLYSIISIIIIATLLWCLVNILGDIIHKIHDDEEDAEEENIWEYFLNLLNYPKIVISEFKKDGLKTIIFLLLVLSFIVLNFISNCENISKIFEIIIIICVFLLPFCIKNRIDDENNSLDTADPDNCPLIAMPFGPALILASAIGIFYINQIKELILNFY